MKKFNINDLIIIEIENRDDCDDIQKYLSKITGASTVSNNVIIKYYLNI